MRKHYDDDGFVSPSNDEIEESSMSRKNYLSKLHRFPDCRDPGHPGCPICEGMDECDDEVDSEGDELFDEDDIYCEEE